MLALFSVGLYLVIALVLRALAIRLLCPPRLPCSAFVAFDGRPWGRVRSAWLRFLGF